MSDDEFKSAKDFVARMDAGTFDGRLHAETKKLSHDQLSEVAEILRLRSLPEDLKRGGETRRDQDLANKLE